MHRCFEAASLAVLTAVAGVSASLGQPQRITTMVHADVRTGKLVRSVIVTSKPVSRQRVAETVVQPMAVSNTVPAASSSPLSATGASAGIDEAVERIAAQHSLPPQLLHSVIQVESNYDALAVSSKGAQGLMQLIPSTARRFGVSDTFNPVENIQGGARYLKYLLDLYHGNYPLALAAYNAGEGAVAKYRGVPPYSETRNYLVLVRKRLTAARQADAARPKAPEPKAAAPVPVGAAHIQEVTQPDGTVRYVVR